MQKDKIIGKVIATESKPTTIDNFYFWTKQDLILNPFDVVKIEHINNSVSYGVIEEISHITDSVSFLSNFISSDFGDINCSGNTYRVGMNYVYGKVIYNTENIYLPLQNDAKVSLANKEEIIRALGLLKEDSEYGLVCGYLNMYQGMNDCAPVRIPVPMDTRFLIGPEGAHLNISGISGLASKTSYAMFLLKALQDKMMAAKDDNKDDVAYILFNVKGTDLLSIDKEPDKISKGVGSYSDIVDEYKKLGLSPTPFKQVQYFYPYSDKNQNNTYANKNNILQEQMDEKKAFYYKFPCNQDNKENLDLMFSNIDDSNQTMDAILNFIATDHSFQHENSWEEFIKKIDNKQQAGSADSKKEITVQSWRKFARIIKSNINGKKLFDDVKMNSNEIELLDKINEIKPNDVYVIDIARLDENMQNFVFGNVIRYIYNLKLGGDEGCNPPSKIIIFMDELNKYASSDIPKNSPILRQILDIAERGRSLGIILFAAEQFRSAIHDRVTGNSSASAYGRTNAIEIEKKDYRYIPQVYKNIMTRLEQGEYIIHNPAFRTMLKIKFPKPIYKESK